MKTKSRITSILNATSLDCSINGITTFSLSELNLKSDLDFQLPSNLRLGHLAEKIVSELISTSTNYKVLYENIQVIEHKRTIGEIDFIIEEKSTKRVIHLEMAYKFYLFDPSISSESINNWIGPNRNDSLKEKIEKLERKQFPLLYHENSKSRFINIEISDTYQALCLLVSLFIPYEYKESFSPIYKNTIKGYYLNIDTFIGLNHSEKNYYIPLKKEWGIEPSDNEIWKDFKGIEKCINTSIKEKQALLCWQKYKDSYFAFFIVWW